MSKRKRIFTAKTYQKWVKEGRGQGRGSDYKPWYKIQDVSSYGLCHRIQSEWTTGRETHLLSNLERDWFFVFDWSPIVIDIREQFPLLPLQETQAIAAECGVNHPVDRRSKEGHPVVLTSDFRLTVRIGNQTVDQIRTVKYVQSLSSQRVLEKFEIERRYWARRGVDWAIVTNRDLPRNLARNIELLRGRQRLSDRLSLSPEQLYTIAQILTDKVEQEQLPLREASAACEILFELAKGSGLTIAYYLLANRYWEVDMCRRIDPGRPLSLVRHNMEALQPSERRVCS
jgi:hypothetical protein